MKRLTTFATALILIGCASNPDKVTAIYISPLKYEPYDCSQLLSEQGNINNRLDAVYYSMKKERKKDNWATGVGIVLFWPALFALAGNNHVQEVELAQMKGELEAVQDAQVKKGCRVSASQIDSADNRYDRIKVNK